MSFWHGAIRLSSGWPPVARRGLATRQPASIFSAFLRRRSTRQRRFSSHFREGAQLASVDFLRVSAKALNSPASIFSAFPRRRSTRA